MHVSISISIICLRVICLGILLGNVYGSRVYITPKMHYLPQDSTYRIAAMVKLVHGIYLLQSEELQSEEVYLQLFKSD